MFLYFVLVFHFYNLLLLYILFQAWKSYLKGFILTDFSDISSHVWVIYQVRNKCFTSIFLCFDFSFSFFIIVILCHWLFNRLGFFLLFTHACGIQTATNRHTGWINLSCVALWLFWSDILGFVGRANLSQQCSIERDTLFFFLSPVLFPSFIFSICLCSHHFFILQVSF